MTSVRTELDLPGTDIGIDMVNPFIQFWSEFSSGMPGLDTSLPMIGAAVLVAMIGWMLASRFFSKMKRLGFGGFAAGTLLSGLVGFPMQVGVLLLILVQTAINVVIMLFGAALGTFGV